MQQWSRKLTLVFAAGALGGLANSLAVWLFGVLGITAALGVKIAPAFTPDWLYPRIVWGGLWGFLLVLPFLRYPYWLRGIFYSLAPTLVQLLIVFPVKGNQGLLGLKLGVLTPLFVLFFNAIWGITAALWLKFIEEKRISTHSYE
ncbi:hypothetical protein [Coleofasciculus sp. FACHB-1120]|uniref:hypothetical protein n=1 Tax=Coleofasciculus sp. FACHB-1120 TaxID=2692783 RepID=UPI001685029F|nr:hypothetical protein [Coleofasciculus sp. FACHB-1120]MBD2744895.1 hypothetical protein [Coleofasciculus sp. FACHB-1120]